MGIYAGRGGGEETGENERAALTRTRKQATRPFLWGFLDPLLCVFRFDRLQALPALRSPFGGIARLSTPVGQGGALSPQMEACGATRCGKLGESKATKAAQKKYGVNPSTKNCQRTWCDALDSFPRRG